MECPECKSTHVIKQGNSVTRQGKKQRYQCRECGRTFYNEEKPSNEKQKD